MNSKILPVAIGLLFFATLADSASIYKCTKKDKTVIFTDGKCPANTEVSVIHEETAQETAHRILDEKILILKKLIASNQTDAAKEYAQKNNLSEIYHEQLAIDAQQKMAVEKQREELDKQQQQAIQQQAIAVQQQQLELQKQQMAIEKQKLEQQQQVIPNQLYYPYLPSHHYRPENCNWSHQLKRCLPPPNMQPFSPSGLNPPPSAMPSQMNPPTSGGLNPAPAPMNRPAIERFNPQRK